MICYNIETCRLHGTKYMEVLEKYFPYDGWGCVAHFYSKHSDTLIHLEICKVENGTWTHYANLQLWDDGEWELSEQFMPVTEKFCKYKGGEEFKRWIGTEQTGMYIYGYFKTFANAVRSLSKRGTSVHGRKPIKVYV